MSKRYLLGVYRTKLNQIQLAYVTMMLMSWPDTPDYFNTIHSQMPQGWKDFPNAGVFLRQPDELKNAVYETYESAHRDALKTLFEATKHYCSISRQLERLQSQSWYSFWRILRNCWSHQMTFDFNRRDLSHLPVSWSGVEIKPEHQGQHVSHSHLSKEKLREFLYTTFRFVDRELS